MSRIIFIDFIKLSFLESFYRSVTPPDSRNVIINTDGSFEQFLGPIGVCRNWPKRITKTKIVTGRKKTNEHAERTTQAPQNLTRETIINTESNRDD